MGPGRDAVNSQDIKTAQGIPEENLQLVPCRWSHTGWKYVQKDPGNTNFFTNPNRVNSFGFSTSKKKRYMTKSVTGQDVFVGDSEFQTSYSRFFDPTAQTQDVKTWKQKFNNAYFGSTNSKVESAPKDVKLIQWAGGLHQRSDFNKRRDPLGQWTEVMFHH